MKKFILILIFFTLNCQAQQNPQTITKQFYDWRIQIKSTGVPEQAELNTAKAYLSSELICLLDRARQYRDLFKQTSPDDKPPFIEGDMFSSLFEGPNRYRLLSTQIKNTHATIRVHLYHDQAEQKDKTGWSDTVQLTKQNQQWRIADIRYGARFDFGNRGSLRQNLIDELGRDDPTLHWDGKLQLHDCR